MDLHEDETTRPKMDFEAWKRSLVRILILAKEKMNTNREKLKKLKELKGKKLFTKKGKDINQDTLFFHKAKYLAIVLCKETKERFSLYYYK